MSDKPGQELPRNFGNYSLLKLLARGGMGEIYLARTQGITGFEKYYAVKKLLKKFTHDNDVGGRFVDEAKLGARLQHPNIVQVYDLGRVSEELYMATEFVDGFDLRRVLRFCHEKKKRIPLDIALFIVREVLSGLAYAHRQVDAEGQSINLIHRDISPQNVLVSFEGEVKIIDFGLAKSTQRSQETQANVLLGNFGYMSPEQARGQILDVRTDIYSCGIVLFELVTGTKRFVEENPLKLLEMVARPTPIMPSDRVPSAPKALDKIYAKATSHEKDSRYPTAEAFRDDVTTALHRLNPRASRENLAQFLNHLFLGGQAPPSVDNDVLNKSVVLVARDLHASTDALSSASPADDLKNRALGQGFSEDAPQTASHPLLRSARVGDVLSHEAITGVSEPAMDPATLLAEAGPAIMDSSLDAVPIGDSDIDQAFGNLGLTAQIKNEVRTNEQPPSSQDGAVMSAEDDDAGQRPTRVYDSPSWPGAPVTQSELEQKHAQDEVQRQLEQQAADLEVQRQLEAQMQAQMEAQVQAQMQVQMQEQMQLQARATAQQEQTRQEALARQLEVSRQAQAQQAAAEEQQRQASTQRQLEQQARQQALQQQMLDMQAAQAPPPPPPAPPPAVPRTTSIAGSSPSRRIQPLTGGTATETAMPAVNVAPPVAAAAAAAAAAAPPAAPSGPVKKPPRAPQVEQPSIVISADLESEVMDEQQTMRNPRASASSPAAASGGFGEGGTHDSLIIDFASEAESSDEEIPVVEGTPSPIRPAARPMGKAAPPPAAPKVRRASDEGPPSTMPPPTRRR
ncbi:MAG: protein kinase [Deltaproteobacteria bacterium]|nr:protein kinase [Deltaproteobacteria bacterium]